MPLHDFDREEVEAYCDHFYGVGEWSEADFAYEAEEYRREFLDEDDS
jgi:hypothetical protein